MSTRNIVILGVCVAVAIAFSASLSSIVEFNVNGQYQVLQSISGEMTVVNKPGPYFQAFGTVTTYPYADTITFINDDSVDNADPAPEVRFTDNGTAKISSTVQYSLPSTEVEQLALHKTYRSYENFKNNVMRRMTPSAITEAAKLMTAEESYASRRSELRSYAKEQLENGLYVTEFEDVRREDLEGNDFIERVVRIKKDANGIPAIPEPSPVRVFGVKIIAFTIENIDFDKTVDDLFAKKKEAEQQKVVARANAERAKQDAITAEEQGKAKVAEAKAEKEVEKIAAVTAAEKEFKVAELEKLRDKENAEAALIKARAEAEGARLKVAAGLSPLERATIDKDTAIGVAAELAKIQLPNTMVFGGGNQSPTNPFDAIGLKAYMDITKRITEESK